MAATTCRNISITALVWDGLSTLQIAWPMCTGLGKRWSVLNRLRRLQGSRYYRGLGCD